MSTEVIKEPFVEIWNNRRWTAADETAAENELVDFISTLVFLIKPFLAIETGTYQGATAMAIAKALQKNNAGKLRTCDLNNPCIVWSELDCCEYIEFHQQNSFDFLNSLDNGMVDFAFLDGGDRLMEFEAILPKLSSSAYVLIHDTRRLSTYERSRLDDLSDFMQRIDLETPRGAALFH